MGRSGCIKAQSAIKKKKKIYIYIYIYIYILKVFGISRMFGMRRKLQEIELERC